MILQKYTERPLFRIWHPNPCGRRTPPQIGSVLRGHSFDCQIHHKNFFFNDISQWYMIYHWHISLRISNDIYQWYIGQWDISMGVSGKYIPLRYHINVIYKLVSMVYVNDISVENQLSMTYPMWYLMIYLNDKMHSMGYQNT